MVSSCLQLILLKVYNNGIRWRYPSGSIKIACVREQQFTYVPGVVNKTKSFSGTIAIHARNPYQVQNLGLAKKPFQKGDKPYCETRGLFQCIWN